MYKNTYTRIKINNDTSNTFRTTNGVLQGSIISPIIYDIFINEDYEHAIHVSELKLERDPLQIESHWHLGFCNLLAKRFEEALVSFNNALELDPIIVKVIAGRD